jgi:hypothetical protein
MKRFLKLIQLKASNYFRFVFYPYKAYLFVRNMIREGGHDISTPFVYGQQQYGFRTVIHLDGSVNNFIPDAAGYYQGKVRVDTSQDPHWLDTFRLYQYQHVEQVDDFIAAMREHTVLLQTSVTTILHSANAGSLAWGLWQTDESFIFGSAGLTLYTIFLRKYTSGIMVKGLWWIMRRVALGQRVLDKLAAKMPRSG